MNEPEQPWPQPPEQPLPDPSGSPVKAAKTLSPAFDVAASVVGVVLGGGVALMLVVGIATPTMGGRHSTQLKWQEQQHQAEEAATQDKTSQAEHPLQPKHE